MAEEETKKIDTEAPSESEPPPSTEPESVEVSKETGEVVTTHPEPKPDESKALAVVEDKPSEGSVDRGNWE